MYHVLFLHDVSQQQREQRRENTRHEREDADLPPRSRPEPPPTQQRCQDVRGKPGDEQQLIGEARSGKNYKREPDQKQHSRPQSSFEPRVVHVQQSSTHHPEVHDHQPMALRHEEDVTQRFASREQ